METNHRLFVFTNAKPGHDAAFNDWYDNTHLPQILALPMVVSAQRFEVQPDAGGEVAHRYLAVYEVAGDPADAQEAIAKGIADGSIEMRDVMGPSGPSRIVVRPLTDLRTE
jgi:hypothetical protein